jgi:hypothetical protein
MKELWVINNKFNNIIEIEALIKLIVMVHEILSINIEVNLKE